MNKKEMNEYRKDNQNDVRGKMGRIKGKTGRIREREM